MELWIRSQDKTKLRKIDNIYYYYEICNEHSLYTDGIIELGTYKTKERALEVLDEIQDILDTQKSYEKFAHLITKDTKIIEFSNVIYEMPKE